MIPLPYLKDSSMYRKIEQRLKFIDPDIKFSTTKNRSFTSFISKVELYNRLYDLTTKFIATDEKVAIIQTLNMIRLYMTNDEKTALRKRWLKV